MNQRIFPHILLLLALISGSIHAQSATVFTVQENGSRDQQINIVFLSEGYTASDMPAFATHVNNAVAFLFSKEPWQQYRSYCNVYRIEIASNQSGCDNGDTSGAGGIRDTYFNAGFNTPSVGQLLSLAGTGSSRAYSLLNTHVPEYDVPVVMVNDTKYGGAGGGISVTSVHSASAAVLEHEIGHSFANLADEYDIEYAIYTPQERSNNTAQTTRSLIKWNHWIDASTPIPTPETFQYEDKVGLFEGSMYRTSGWYRPHEDSLMRNLDRPCGNVNREQFVLKYYSRVSPIDSSSPPTTNQSISTFQNLSFNVTPKSPSSGGPMVINWKVDGVIQTGATAATFNTVSEQLGNGTHTITATVRDATPFVRLDPSGLLDDTVTWTLTLSNQLPSTLAAWRTAFGNDTANPSGDGMANMIKYALGRNPSERALPNQFPEIRTTDGYLSLVVPRRNKRTDVEYIVEVSDKLGTWNSGPGHTVTLVDEESSLVVRDATPMTGASSRFIRLKVRER